MSGLKNRTIVTIARRAIAVLVVAVFCFHLSRFYVAVEVCSHHTKDGYALQHCKDISGWLTAPRVKMDKVFPPITYPTLVLINVSVAAPSDPVPDIPLPPPFHPPRNLS